jgi:hypothetical protein
VARPTSSRGKDYSTSCAQCGEQHGGSTTYGFTCSLPKLHPVSIVLSRGSRQDAPARLKARQDSSDSAPPPTRLPTRQPPRLASSRNRSTSSLLNKDATEIEPCKIRGTTPPLGSRTGAGRQGNIFSFRSREKNVLDFSSYRSYRSGVNTRMRFLFARSPTKPSLVRLPEVENFIWAFRSESQSIP